MATITITDVALRSYGLSGEPLRMTPDSLQTVVGAIRKANLDPANTALVDAATALIADLDPAMNAADIILSAPVTGEFTETHSGLELTVTDSDAALDLPPANVQWGFGDGTDPVFDSTGEVVHTYKVQGVYIVTKRVAVAGVIFASSITVDIHADDSVTVPPVVSNPPTGVNVGQPGSFTPGGSDVPADLAALQALGTLGQTGAWSADAFVALGDSTFAQWDGTVWIAFTPALPRANPTGATAGTPGSFVPANAVLPADLAALQALGDLGQTTAWATGESVVLDDGTDASWDGTDWVAGVAADEPDGEEPPDDVIVVIDPSTMTVDEVKAWVDALPHNGHGHDAVQQVLDLERSGSNRSTLVDWLDAKLGAI